MEKVTKKICKEETVDGVFITEEEFKDTSTKVGADVIKCLAENVDDAVTMAAFCAKYTGRMMTEMFHNPEDDDDEEEE